MTEKLLTVTWSVIRDDGPDAYVLEFTDGQLSLTFGPMPTGIVEQFLIERKRKVAAICDDIIKRLSNENPSKENQ